jgi:hypothetical protein
MRCDDDDLASKPADIFGGEADTADETAAVDEALRNYRASIKGDLQDKEGELADKFQARLRASISEAMWPKTAWNPSPRRSFSDNQIRYLIFDPLSSSRRTARINPLDGVRVGTMHEVRDAERIAEALLGLDVYPSRSANDVHFMEHGVRVLSALMLHVLYTPETERTLAAVLSAITDEAFYDLNTLINYVCGCKHDLDAKMDWKDAYGRKTFTHPAIRQRLRSARTMAKEEASGIFTTVTRGLALFADPTVAQNTAVTDFDFDDLFDGLALALRVPPRAERLAPVYRAVVAILSDRIDERCRFGPLKYPPFLTIQPTPEFPL